MSEYIIEINNLSVTLAGKPIIEDINMTIAEEDFLILFGDDNAGKTTLLNALMGFINCKAGEVKVLGQNVDVLPIQNRQTIRFVPDNIIMESEMTAAEYFSFMRLGNADYDFELETRLCEKFEVDGQEVLLNMTYQGNKLVALIAAICARPRLLILDEPYNFLGKATMKAIMQELDILNQQGTCIVLAVEKYEHALQYGSRYIYLVDGAIKNQGEIAATDFRQKAVTVPKEHNRELGQRLGEILGEQKYTVTYRYTGTMQELLDILQELQCEDFTVEDITLREELDEDYLRWE